jgi:glycosyltransferase involved in cell wall biosynthesis
MRVLFLSTWFPFPLSQGSKIRAYYLIRAVARHHDAALISFAEEPIETSWLDHIHQFCGQVKLVEKNPFATTRIERLRGWLSKEPSFVRSAYSKDMVTLVRQFADQWKPDRIVAFTFVMGAYALKANRTFNIIDVDNFMSQMMFEAYKDAEDIKMKARRYLAWKKFLNYEKWLYNQYDRCLVVTDKDRDSLSNQLGLNPKKICVIPNGVDTNYHFPMDEPPRANTLVFNGSLRYQANFDAMAHFLKHIFPAILSENPLVRLSITGRNDGVAFDRLPNLDCVDFTGYLDDVRPVVRRSWVCVVPLRMGGGTRLKILEAMALGTPVVSTSKGAEGLSVTQGKNILIADDPGEFAIHVARLLRDPMLRQSLSLNASQLVKEKYGWEMIGDRFSNCLDQISI